MIVGTAGHIDHGKTTLVRALTGVDTDRLKEEKARGISIELGYAYAPLPNGDVLGFIDVPGHEKLVHTMAAGASGIDFGLLVVAADDGVMPQTREHLAILSLLGVRSGAVALTKSDRADASQLAAAQHGIDALVAGTFLEHAPVFTLSATTADDAGVAALLVYLQTQALNVAARRRDGLFRLAVDRVFTLTGHGTVVTGTVHSGVVRAGDDAAELCLMPAGTRLRVRSIHAQNQPSEIGVAGQRCALNLPGIEKSAIARGDWIAEAGALQPSRNIDVTLHLLDTADVPVRAWSPLHIHIGAAHHVAHVVPLSADTLAPGESGWVQLVFDEPICAVPGDRFIARNAQATRTVGGGVVLDPQAPDRKRRAASRMAWLHGVSALLADQDVRPLLEQATQGLEAGVLVRLTGQPVQDTYGVDGAIWVAGHASGKSEIPRTLILASHWDTLKARVLHVLAGFHQSSPDEPGPDAARLRRMALPTAPEGLWIAFLDSLIDEGRLARTGPWLHLPEHVATLSEAEERLAQQLLARLALGAFDPPWVRDLAALQTVPEEQVRQLLRKLLRRGEVAQVVRDLFYHREQIRLLAEHGAALAATPGGLHAAAFRDATGLGRKRAIQVLEFFNRVGYTRRVRDTHVLRADSAFASAYTVDA